MFFALGPPSPRRLHRAAIASAPRLSLHPVASAAGAASAALAAPVFSAVGQVCWERWTGSALVLNLFKCSLAALLFACVLCVQSAAGVPLAALSSRSARMLALSAILGVVVGDLMWLQALQMIGSRACILLTALQPCVAALAGAVCLGQPLRPRLLFGTTLTSAGLVIAHLGRTASLSALVQRLASSLQRANARWLEQLTEQRRQQDEHALPDTCQGGELLLANDVMIAILEWLCPPPPPSPPRRPAQSWEAEAGRPVETAAASEEAEEGSGDFATKDATATSAAASVATASATASATAAVASGSASARTIVIGYTLALSNMVLDVLGATITRAHGVGLSTFQINGARFGFAAALTAAALTGARLRAVATSARPPAWARLPALSPREWGVVAGGVVLVTFLCPALSNLALFRLPLGAWASLTALGPVYAIPIFFVMRGERTRSIGVLGAALASLGAAVVSAS